MCNLSTGIYNKGYDSGYDNGYDSGVSDGEKKGEKKGILETLFGLVKDGILSIADAAKHANMSVADFEKAYKTFCL